MFVLNWVVPILTKKKLFYIITMGSFLHFYFGFSYFCVTVIYGYIWMILLLFMAIYWKILLFMDIYGWFIANSINIIYFFSNRFPAHVHKPVCQTGLWTGLRRPKNRSNRFGRCVNRFDMVNIYIYPYLSVST